SSRKWVERIVGVKPPRPRHARRFHAPMMAPVFFEDHTMHAWLCENPVGADALQWKEMPTPQPKAGEVLIRIAAASLNFPDLLIVQNKYQMKPALPFVPGSEYAGTIVAVGEGVTALK